MNRHWQSAYLWVRSHSARRLGNRGTAGMRLLALSMHTRPRRSVRHGVRLRHLQAKPIDFRELLNVLNACARRRDTRALTLSQLDAKAVHRSLERLPVLRFSQ